LIGRAALRPDRSTMTHPGAAIRLPGQGATPMSTQPIIAVYKPPEAGFPWLAVTISPDGTVAATAHATFDAADAATLKNLSAASKGLGSD
jgi:hypothetical protein